MRKTLSLLVLISVIILAFSQLVLPGIIRGTIASRIKEATNAETVDVQMHSKWGIYLLFGHIDSIHIDADKAMVGQIRVDKLTLDGENIDGDLTALDVRDGSAVTFADRLEMVGVISQESLRELLVRKLEHMENIETVMDKDKLSASGQVKLGGKKADVTLEGTVYNENGGVYFHMTKLDIRNAVFGKAVIGNFFGDILLFDLHKMPITAEVDDVEQQDGQVVIRASRHNAQR